MKLTTVMYFFKSYYDHKKEKNNNDLIDMDWQPSYIPLKVVVFCLGVYVVVSQFHFKNLNTYKG